MAKKEALREISDDVHNVKTLTYINFTILIILLAFVIGVVLKQLGL